MGAGDRGALHAKLLALCRNLPLEALPRVGGFVESGLEVCDPALELLNDASDVRIPTGADEARSGTYSKAENCTGASTA